MRIHIGEWGWDISPNSPLNAPAFGKYSAHQVSAMWSARALLLMAENEMNASSYYRIKQDYDALDDNSGIVFATMALLRFEDAGTKQPDGSYTGMIINRTLTGDYFLQLSKILSSGYAFAGRISTNPTVLKFTNGTRELYIIWNPEKMTVTDRPAFTEVTSSYILPKSGILKRFVDNGSGEMSREVYSGGTPIKAEAKPVLIEADLTILPIHEPSRPPVRPVVPQLYTIEVYNSIGQLLMKKTNVQLSQVKDQLQKGRIYILKYYNSKTFKTEKFIKTW